MINLKFHFQFSDLYNTSKLKELDSYFLDSLDLSLKEEVIQARLNFKEWKIEHSNLAISLAPHLEKFVSSFFNIENELIIDKQQYTSLAKIYECKRLFVQRYALKSSQSPKNVLEELSQLISPQLSKYDINHFEQIFAEYALSWLSSKDQEKLDIASQYAIWACLDSDGIKKHQSGTLFKFPHKLDADCLIPAENDKNTWKIPADQCHERDGFKLTDPGCELNFAVDQSHYCIHCHRQDKDSCSKGFKKEEKNGCPLDEKISEINYLKSQGNIIGPLAMAIIDNPMLAATGHRICNDCMKACIFQKQQPVDIPQIETRVLKDVLKLSWGFEIYSLLTRWNPLSFAKPLPKEDTGAKVLVAGMGPAGFTLAHYLLNEGHIVVAVDGLKIEPLAEFLHQPIKEVDNLFKELDKRVIGGFGGVMEYGITNRWNKNFLLLIRLLLERRDNFKLFGGVRFGSNITPKQAFEMGFQHVALALGAGKPRLLSLPDGMAKGVRTASDFLMSLQLGKAYEKDSLTNLQMRMPVVVIGGGLTALDAATEAMAYYPKLAKKFASKYKEGPLNEEAKELLRDNKLFEKSDSNFSVMKSLGGVKILYRNKLQKAPSYRLNHEELSLGLKEGIEFVENITPSKIILDEFGYVKGLEAVQIIDDKEQLVTLDAKTILIAAGTVPNVVLSQEFPEILEKDGAYFRKLDNHFITYNNCDNSMSFFGDLHPDYAGNVVKAMASAKRGYPSVSKLLKKDKTNAKEFFNHLSTQLMSSIVEVNRLAPNIVELVVNSPLAAKNFEPGQFFRLQNYAHYGLPLMEGIALTGAKVDKVKGTISTIVLEMGGSSNLCAKLQIGENIVLMGPTGTPTEITSNEKVMLVGGGLGNAVLFSIGQALREKGSEVLYFAGYRKIEDRYKIEEIEAAANQIIWSCDEDELQITRDQDKTFHGNIVESIVNFAKENPAVLKTIDRIIVIGSDKMMHAVKKARSTVLLQYLNPEHTAIASINSPMQCMMKEICGQCLQKHIDPVTGEESYVFSCTNQDQEMDRVDFLHLEARLSQNHILEKLYK
ncbi:MAG: FAD-dependent oxidoreductase [Rickettsiales bacterium]|jgi:NADPH-dependent glutamate synthase beta subunit-like oxidoreductase/NAD(P)H-flavin reductase|nr:FAD-dependent oxidoreductase [Rickettsiales bacterium]